jgi:hypothetical protein
VMGTGENAAARASSSAADEAEPNSGQVRRAGGSEPAPRADR